MPKVSEFYIASFPAIQSGQEHVVVNLTAPTDMSSISVVVPVRESMTSTEVKKAAIAIHLQKINADTQ